MLRVALGWVDLALSNQHELGFLHTMISVPNMYLKHLVHIATKELRPKELDIGFCQTRFMSYADIDC